MLILTRRKGESIVMRSTGPENWQIRVTIMDDRRNSQVRIGIDAPPDIEVWRDEIFEKIEQQEASKAKQAQRAP